MRKMMTVTEIKNVKDAREVIISQLYFFVEKDMVGNATLKDCIEAAIEDLVDSNYDDLNDEQIKLLERQLPVNWK